jgi:hypothetical protein
MTTIHVFITEIIQNYMSDPYQRISLDPGEATSHVSSLHAEGIGTKQIIHPLLV